MSKKFEKLKTLLKELFQLDHPDLDFGLYRIMHAKAAEVTQFLERDLLPQVKEEFGQYKTADKAEIEQQLAKAIEQAEALGADPDSLPKVKELRAKLTDDAVDLNALESEVYDHLFSFFRRYYSEGDFLSKRVYKPGVYAIPYEGEEVKLHWANADQYYIKTSEYLRDYAFRLRPEDDANPMRVHFRLVDAAEGEHGNVKAAEGKDRIFILAANDFIAEKDGEQGKELVILFEYRPATLTDWPDDVRDSKKKPPTQKEMTALAEARIAAVDDKALEKWIAAIRKAHEKADGEQADYSRLHAHLNRYVGRNTFDYFIHKDLGAFLRRELDFYVKNEVMHLDDIESESVPRVEQYLSKIKVIRRIASKIIDFLAQLEDFQKKLWLKKKFVVASNYLVTLDRIPRDLYEEIAVNDRQRCEWVELFGIDKIEKTLHEAGYTEPLTVEFLQSQPFLVLDTSHFCNKFKERLLNSFEELDESLNGTLIHGENFHAMHLVTPRFDGRVKCVYLDPPYNTGKDGFAYRDAYQRSSWLSFIWDRISLSRRLLADDGALFCSIDDNEAKNVEFVLNAIFGEAQQLAPFFIQVRYANKTLSEDNDFQRTIERVFFYGKDRYKTKPVKDSVAYPVEKFCWRISEISPGAEFTVAGKRCWVFKPGEYKIEKVAPHHGGLKETWATGSLLRQKGSSGEFFGTNLAPRKSIDGLQCLYKVEGIGEDGLGYRYFTGPQRESASKGKFYSGIPLQTLEKIKSGDATKGVPIHNFYDFAGDFGNCRLEGKVDILGGKKPEKLLERLISFSSKESDEEDIVLDPFSGSGTVPSVAHKLQKRYIAIEQGEYFDSKILVRMKYTLNGTSGGISEVAGGTVRYLRLESYEDALKNLQMRRSKAQQSLLETAQNTELSRLKEQYILGYMLNVESEGSQSLLNVQGFIDPTAYKLMVKRPGSDESREVNVDLLETFNWLIGLTVQHIAAPQCFEAKLERDSENRLQVKGRLKQVDSGDHWFRTVTGTTPDGRKTLVIWRKRPGGETPEGVEQDNLVLDEWFTRQGYSSKDSEFDLIYVNGTNNLENLRAPDDTWKVRLIEDDFHRLMFASEGI